jgi:hypothetical protein
MPMKNRQIERQIVWDDLPYVAVVAELDEQMLQAAVLFEGRQVAHLFLLKDGLLALTEVEYRSDLEPTDELLLAIARVQVAHLRACREGRSLL